MKKYTFQILILAALVLTACGGTHQAATNQLAGQMNLLATSVPGSAITQAGSYMIAAFPKKIQSPDKSYISVVLAYTTTTFNAPEVPPFLTPDAQVRPTLMFDNGTSSILTSSTFLPCLPAKNSDVVFVYANQPQRFPAGFKWRDQDCGAHLPCVRRNAHCLANEWLGL